MNPSNFSATISPMSFDENTNLAVNEPNDVIDVTKYKRMISKLKQKNTHYKEEINQLQKTISTLKISNDRNQAEINSLKEDQQVLQLQLEAGHASHIESETAWASVKAQNNQLMVANESLQNQIDNQRAELGKYSKGREEMVGLIKNLNDALCKSESNYSKVFYENQELMKKRRSPKLFENDSIDFSYINVPYKDSNMNTKITNIIKSNQLKSPQKVQAIINETSSALEIKDVENDHIKSEINELKKEAEKRDDNSQKMNDLYTKIFNELKQVEISSHGFDGKMFCDTNQAFTSFMVKHALDFDFIQKNSHVSYELFSEEVRSQILSQYDGLSKTLFAAIFIINSELKKQLNSAKEAILQMDNLTDAVKIFGCKKPEELPERINRFIQKIEKYQINNQKLCEALKESKRSLQKSEKQIESLTSQNDTLIEANNQLKSKMASLTNELALVRPETRQISPASLKYDQYDQKKDATIQQLKAEIAQKDTVIQKLNSSNESLKIENLKFKEIEVALRQKLDALQRSFQQLKLQHYNDQQKAKRKIKNIQRSHEKEINEMNDQVEEMKCIMSQTIAEYHNKIEQLTDLSKNLSNSLAESEKRNKDLCDDNSRLKIAVQSLQMKISSDEAKMKQERQTNEAKTMAQILAVETKMHETHSSEKAKIESQKQNLIDFVADELGLMYGVDVSDLDEEGFKQLILKVKSDLRKQDY
ncbi:hypothetical protein M9Y10_002208 [Tritrichomonas musculus]|uniref:Uncharacterized protein n=1 Tax=Tritrichomonas musculus TaxID=1915356 RepID=A0ABR2LBX4_9EUKA